jgi:hypothetical protein
VDITERYLAAAQVLPQLALDEAGDSVAASANLRLREERLQMLPHDSVQHRSLQLAPHVGRAKSTNARRTPGLRWRAHSARFSGRLI